MSAEHSTLDQDRAAVGAATAELLAHARRLDPTSLGEPSLCAGWTRGHILTHVARNADALVNLVRSATTGEPIPMYASPQARDADIEAGAGRPLDEQLTDLEESAGRWHEAVQRLGDEHADARVEARNGVMLRAGHLPFMRLREVVFHHVDLDDGFGFAQVEPELLERFLDDQVRRLRHDPQTPSMTIRTDEGDNHSIGDGRPTISGSRAAILGWLTRGLTDDVVGDLPTLPFGG